MLPELKAERDRIKEEIDLRLYVADDLSVKPQRMSARTWMLPCPFHPDDDPSMSVHEDFFKCFGCENKGDVFEYVQRRMGVSFEESIRILGGNVALPEFKRQPSKPEPQKSFTMSLSEVESYHSKVSLVQPYLESRAIPQSIIENRLIGGSKFTKTYVDMQGDSWSFECNRVFFPYVWEGSVYSCNFRRDDLSALQNMAKVAEKRKVANLFSLIRNDLAEKAGHGDPDRVSNEKVMNACFGTRFYRPGAPVTAYGTNNLVYRRDGSLVYPRRSHCILTEGEFNQNSGEAEGFITLATKSVTTVNLPRLLQNVRLIYVAVDPDEAGRKYAEMIFNALKRDTTRVRFLGMDQDMNDLLRAGKLSDYLSRRPNFIQPEL